MTSSTKVTTRQRNRTLLARQLLLDRRSVTIPEALEQMCGIQNQYAPNAYIRLWSCVDGFRRDDLTRAYESAAVVQGTLMRGTIHAVSAGDYHPLCAAIREPRHVWSRRVNGPDDSDRAEVVARMRAALAAGPLRRPDYLSLLDGATKTVRQTIDTDAEILRMPPSGTWDRRRADIFGLADDVIPHVEVGSENARRLLVKRYLGGFGPASVASIATFCGIQTPTIKATLETMDLRTYADDSGRTLFDLADVSISDADLPAPVRFLPTFDSILLVHARDTAVIAEEHRAALFSSKNPQSFPTFMVDGTVAGTWRWDAEADRIALSPLVPLAARTMSDLEDEADRLAVLHR